VKRIQLLPDHVKSKIAAGEVIEGPFSVVKELLENSLDAGATEITLQVSEAGMKKIVVRDNGEGIFPDDIERAVMEHATSKIADIQDIERITSYGFRGEALSSIASVAAVTILSRPAAVDIGARLYADEKSREVSPHAGPAGTTVIVENLFYTTPARKKFLKTQKGEARLVREIFLKIALANSGVSFAFEVDGKRSLTLPAAADLGERIVQIYGSDTARGLNEEELADLKVRVRAYVSRPDALRQSRAMQILYINGRPVEYRYLGFLLSRAYEAVARSGQHPAALVFLEIDPSLVDVNIHPAKREVKLFDQRYIDSLIIGVAEKALNREHRIRADVFRAPAPAEQHRPEGELIPGFVSDVLEHSQRGDEARAGGGRLYDEVFSLREKKEVYTGETPDAISVLGVAFDTYLVVENRGQLTFIDFHAAHERMIYDVLVNRERPSETQELLFPRVLELPLDDFHTLKENLDAFHKIGFDIEEFSEYSIIIRGIPPVVKEADVERVIADFIQSSARGRMEITEPLSRAAASTACHAAKRSGDQLNDHDISALVALIGRGGDLRCPHGRPFVYYLTKNDLERLFKRS